MRSGVIVIVCLAGAVVSAGPEGWKHDFSGKDWSGGDACRVCHVRGTDAPAVAPLWDANADLNRTFGTPLRESQAAGLGTTLCLRCHDGTVARDAIAPATPQTRFSNREHPGRLRAGHSTSNHPVGVLYPSVDEDYRPANRVIASGTVSLPDGRVECTSCHDPHDMSGEKYMLVRNNARSALCLTCHRK